MCRPLHTHARARTWEDYRAMKVILGEWMAVCTLTEVLKWCIHRVDRIHRDLRFKWMTECRRAGKEWMKWDRNGPWMFLRLARHLHDGCDVSGMFRINCLLLDTPGAVNSSTVLASRFLHPCYLYWSHLSSLCMFLYYCTCCTFH